MCCVSYLLTAKSRSFLWDWQKSFAAYQGVLYMASYLQITYHINKTQIVTKYLPKSKKIKAQIRVLNFFIVMSI